MALSNRAFISLAGAGTLGVYHVGVYSKLVECASDAGFAAERQRWIGSSAGALVGAAAACHVNPADLYEAFESINSDAGKHALGAFSPNLDLLSLVEPKLRELLPERAHVIVQDRLVVCTVRVRSMFNWKFVMRDSFNTRDELIEALLYSSSIPYLTTKRRELFKNEMDGGMLNNWPQVSADDVTVSPFGGKFDVSPPSPRNAFRVTIHGQRVDASFENLMRGFACMHHIKNPLDVYEQGRRDCGRFIYYDNDSKG